MPKPKITRACPRTNPETVGRKIKVNIQDTPLGPLVTNVYNCREGIRYALYDAVRESLAYKLCDGPDYLRLTVNNAELIKRLPPGVKHERLTFFMATTGYVRDLPA